MDFLIFKNSIYQFESNGENLNIDITLLCEVAVEAGKKIMEIYESDDFDVELKDDNSPLTKADLISNQTIEKYLSRYFDEFPILSEEGKNISYEERKNWSKYWCVDPLDGTKEFINKTDEFTVNIALIEDHYPVIGVIYAPASKELWYTRDGASYYIHLGEREQIHVNSDDSEGLIAVQSRSHLSQKDADYYSNFNIKENIGIGSSLKFCKVADGSAHIYRRSGPTMEWDTAAGQAILEQAGGAVLLDSGERFFYNKEDLLNPSFVCIADKSWIEYEF